MIAPQASLATVRSIECLFAKRRRVRVAATVSGPSRPLLHSPCDHDQDHRLAASAHSPYQLHLRRLKAVGGPICKLRDVRIAHQQDRSLRLLGGVHSRCDLIGTVGAVDRAGREQQARRWGHRCEATLQHCAWRARTNTYPSQIGRRHALFLLGHISPIFAPFFLVFSRFSPS